MGADQERADISCEVWCEVEGAILIWEKILPFLAANLYGFWVGPKSATAALPILSFVWHRLKLGPLKGWFMYWEIAFSAKKK